MKKPKCHGRFYVKLKVPGGEINAEIREESLYALCCDCGHEFKVTEEDFGEAMFETPYGLRGASFRCRDCTDEWIAWQNLRSQKLNF